MSSNLGNEGKVLIEDIQNTFNKFMENPSDDASYGLEQLMNKYINKGGDITIKIAGRSLYHLFLDHLILLAEKLPNSEFSLNVLIKLRDKGLPLDSDVLTKVFKLENLKRKNFDTFENFYPKSIADGIIPNDKNGKLTTIYISDAIESAEEKPNSEFLRVFVDRFFNENNKDYFKRCQKVWIITFMSKLEENPPSLEKINNLINFGLSFKILDLNTRLLENVTGTPIEHEAAVNPIEFFIREQVKHIKSNSFARIPTPKELEPLIEGIRLFMGYNLNQETRDKMLPYLKELQEFISSNMSADIRRHIAKEPDLKSLQNGKTDAEMQAIRVWMMSSDMISMVQNMPSAPSMEYMPIAHSVPIPKASPSPSSELSRVLSQLDSTPDKGDRKRAAEPSTSPKEDITPMSAYNPLLKLQQSKAQNKDDENNKPQTKEQDKSPNKPQDKP